MRPLWAHNGCMTNPTHPATPQARAHRTAAPFRLSATDRTRQFVTVRRLRDGAVVLAHDNGDAVTFVNLTQARRVAERLGEQVVGRWPFFVEVSR